MEASPGMCLAGAPQLSFQPPSCADEFLVNPQVLDLKFLHCTQRPTVAVLYQARDARKGN